MRNRGAAARERASRDKSAAGVVVPPAPTYPACEIRKAVEVAVPPPTGVVVEMTREGVFTLCVGTGARENKPQGVVLPRPRLLLAEVSVVVAVPVPILKSPPENARSPEKRPLPITESTSFGPTVPSPRRVFVLSQKKFALFWRMSAPSEKRTDPAVNSVVEIEPPVRVRPCEEASPTAESPPLQVEVAVDVLVSEPPAIVRPFCARKEFARMPPSVVEVAVVFSTYHGVSKTVEVAAPAVVRKMPPASVKPSVVMRRSFAKRPPVSVEVALFV